MSPDGSEVEAFRGDALLRRVSGVAGITAALIVWVFGILHPKGASDVGTLREWLTRVSGSDVWVVVHFMFLLASILILVAAVGIARSYLEERAVLWSDLALPMTVVATAVAFVTFLVDGPALKDIADRWALQPADPAVLGAGRLITEVGFFLVAGLQLSKGAVAFLFGLAGLASRRHAGWIGWLAIVAGLSALIPGSIHYLAGSTTVTANATYVSEALFALWVFLMGWRLLAPDRD